jgi:hypothetical protein
MHPHFQFMVRGANGVIVVSKKKQAASYDMYVGWQRLKGWKCIARGMAD